LAAGGGVLRLPPRSDVLPAVLSAISLGPTLVVVPTAADSLLLTSRLRRTGATVATVLVVTLVIRGLVTLAASLRGRPATRRYTSRAAADE